MNAFGFIIILVVLIVIGNIIINRLKEIETLMGFIRNDVTNIQQQIKKAESPVSETVNKPVADEARWMPKTVTSSVPEPPTFKTDETPLPEPEVENVPFKSSEPKIYSTTINPENFFIEEDKPEPAQEPQPNPFAIQPKPAKPTFSEKHPDFEKFIGENIINKIGIAILVLGIGFFVKYAIDQDWINEIGRVFIGILCGGALIGLAHRMRQSFSAFSSVLIGGGLSVLYFTIGIAFSMYDLLSQPAAFAIMVVITAFAVTLSLLYNRIELAVLALIGGFGTPFFVSTGEGNYVVLFTYLIILNSGMLVLAWIKKWNLVNLLAYIFTIILYGGWLIKDMNSDAPHYAGDFFFATIFYFMFWLMNVAFNIKFKTKFETQEFLLLISNTFLFFTTGIVILNHWGDGLYLGLFTVIMGVINFGFALIMHRMRHFDHNLFYMLIGLVLTFISLAAPIQLKGNHITLFWAAESVLLLWLSRKSGIMLIRYASMIVGTLMIISLMMDWKIYQDETLLPIIFNKVCMTGLVSAIALMLYARLYHFTEETSFQNTIPDVILRRVINGIAIGIAYLVAFTELTYQLNHRIELNDARLLYIMGYNFSFVAIMALAFRKNNHRAATVSFVMVIGLMCLLYATLFNSNVKDVRYEWITGSNVGYMAFILHFAFSAIMLYLLYEFKQRLQQLMQDMPPANAWWFVMPVLVYWLSAELSHVVTLAGHPNEYTMDELLTQTHKIGYPIVWGITSFISIVSGLRAKNRTLRIIGLSLFALIVLKLFLFDVWGMSEGGKILAFVLLGVLLLVVSFMYQKLKKILNDDQPIVPE